MPMFPMPTPNISPTFDPQMPTSVPGGMGGGQGAMAPNIQPPPPEPQRPPEEEVARQQDAEFESYKDQLNAFLMMQNVAEKIPEQMLTEIGMRVVEEYDIDFESRREWYEEMKEFIDLASLVGKTKMWGEAVVANVKYPTLATAAIQFAARAYPNIIAGADVVKGKKQGADPDGNKQRRAARMATYMSWQLLEGMNAWDEDTDQLLVTLPIVGCMFRKTYRDGVNNRNVSSLVPAEHLVLNYYAKWGEATRITEHIPMYPNEVVERVRSGKFLDVELGQPVPAPDKIRQNQESRDPDLPHLFLEQHRWEDIDGDGYKEPYVVTVHHATQQVVRIVARFDLDGIHTNDKGKISRIEPVEYYTRYLFFPAFDGGVYGMGFGVLIGPINKTVNTNLNQLLDAGTLANRQGGFLAKGVRLPEGQKAVRFKQGEWKYVDVTGEDLRKGVYPLPVQPPSDVLFKLMQFMVEAAEKLASNAEVLSGNQPQANVPATTTLALIEQGLKVYSSIYLRIHKSLKSEFKKLKRLNRLFLTDEEYQKMLDDAEATIDDFYDGDLDVTPVSDVADLNDMQKIMKAQALRELVGMGLNDMEIFDRYLQALNIPDRQALLTGQPEKTDPKITIQQMKGEIEKMKVDLQNKELEMQRDVEMVKMQKVQADTALVAERANTQEFKRIIDALKLELERQKMVIEALQHEEDKEVEGYDKEVEVVDMAHRHDMERTDREHEAKKLEIEDKKASQKPTPTKGD